jgi:hypothetical protein
MPSRIDRERRTIQIMISLYCRHHHHKIECPDCKQLMSYALLRLEDCPFQEGKTTCAKCPVHCYKPEMREQVRKVMRYSGPRMLYHHPILTIFHFIDRRRNQPLKRALK